MVRVRDEAVRSGPGAPPTGQVRAIAVLQREHRACTRCVEAGFLTAAHPVFGGRGGLRILLVGQAPGPVETDVSRPFAGRAGKQLMRWFERGGFAGEGDVRRRVYMTSMTTCFPGRSPGGSGDRRPSSREVALCAPWLDNLLELLEPRLVLPVGSLALSRFLPGRGLDAAVGRVFGPTGDEVSAPTSPGNGHPAAADRLAARPPLHLPLPHPSGQSRWLNDPARVALLDRALQQLPSLVRWAESE